MSKLLRRLTTHSGSTADHNPSLPSSPGKRNTPSTSTNSSPSRPHTVGSISPGLSERPPPTFGSVVNKALAPSLVVQEPTPPPTKQQPFQLPPRPAGRSSESPSDLRSLPSREKASLSAVQQVDNTASIDTSKKQSLVEVAGSRSEVGPIGAQRSSTTMSRRKVWIKRPGASPTLVTIQHDDVVDEVRDLVLRKYANSLGRTFDSPDVTIRIIPRERSQKESERLLNPEEPICKILEAYYPGGQDVDEALLVDVGTRRTPKPSPRVTNHMTSYFEDTRPIESEGDYFPTMPVVSSNGPATAIPSGERRPSISFHPHSMAILETGHLPQLPGGAPFPSPGIRNRRERPRYGRQHTSSPTIITTAPKVSINSTLHHPGERTQRQPRNIVDTSHAPTPPPMPTPPIPEVVSNAVSAKASTPPLDRGASPRPNKLNNTRDRKSSNAIDRQNGVTKTVEKTPTYSFLEGIVPPINVLIVEDNPINLRLLEMFAKRLKVRWSTAMNGRDAVLKWKTGGFHLVLMDIQLPIMSGLEATKEIRRLERVNGIGVFAKSESEERSFGNDGTEYGAENTSVTDAANGDGVSNSLDGTDKLDGVFKSPIIIVALTASSLQSDRHEALAAGCNDFLTKVRTVNTV